MNLSPAEDVPLQPQLWELPVWSASNQHSVAMGAPAPVA
jgi:hypothetical protein